MFLTKGQTGLWIVDVQENLFPLVDRSAEVLEKICFVIEAAKTLRLPIFVTEQYPKGLGPTVAAIKERLPAAQPIYAKTAFSGYYEPPIKAAADSLGVQTWILIGIEAHICILQTAKDLLAAGKKVVILSDAISARSVLHFSTALAELALSGARNTCAETVLYELVRDANSHEFKTLLPLVKEHA